MVNLIGFDGPEAYSIIFWQINGEDQSKTVCYSAEEEATAISRFHSFGDFYNQYDKAVVVYPYQLQVEYVRVEMRGA